MESSEKEIKKLLKQKRISKIVETEKNRYLNFFSNSYKNNLKHSAYVLKEFPRWSIISGYYAMHDLTKLFLADKFMIKVDLKVHETTIRLLETLIKDKQIIALLNIGYNEFISLLNDLADAKEKRTKAQYYTGTGFMHQKYKKEANDFLNNTVTPYIKKIKSIKENVN